MRAQDRGGPGCAIEALRATVARLEQRSGRRTGQFRTPESGTFRITAVPAVAIQAVPFPDTAFQAGVPQTGIRQAGVLEVGVLQVGALQAGVLQIGTLQAGVSQATPRETLRFGIAGIDAHLPAGGLDCAGLHEFAGVGPDTEHGATPALLVAGLLARHPGRVLWASERRDVFAPALAAVGLHPNRIMFVEAGRSVLAVMEEGLRHAGLTGVVGELSGPLGLTASRRLQLAAEAAGAAAFVVRRSRRHDDPALAAPSAAATRWRVAALPAPPPRLEMSSVPGVGRAHWQLDLVRCRGGMPASWTLEACDAQNRLALAAELRHGPAAAADGWIGRNDGKDFRPGRWASDMGQGVTAMAERGTGGPGRGAAGPVAA